MTRRAATRHYENKVGHLLKAKASQWYSNIKQMIGKTEVGLDFNLDEDAAITANNLNAHLAHIVQSLPPLPKEEIPAPPPTFNGFPEISKTEVRTKLEKLKRTSITPVDIPVDLIKAFPDYLSSPLADIFNQITKTGEYPSVWKNGFITPIPKKDSPNDFSGVRPITMTPIFSKVYESFLCTWLKNHILESIDPGQYGNMPHTSTSHYLISLLDKILSHLDEPERWVNLIAIDLKKAFDLICHSVLLKKLLANFNVQPFLVRIVANFLSDRTQRTKYKSCYSDPLPIFCGVPQGTLLGPLLFLVMINDLANTIPDRWKYVDDLSVTECCYKNIRSSAAALMSDICEEAAIDKMIVNLEKSVVLTISFLKSSPSFFPELPDSCRVKEIKLLGVYLTSDLRWDKQIEAMLKRANMAIASLKLLSRHGVPPKHLLHVYFSFIRSSLEYCSPVWHFGLTQEQSDRLEKIQYRALLIVSKSPKVPYSSLLSDFRLETLATRRLNISLKFGTSILANPILRKILPPDYETTRIRLPRSVAQPVPRLQPVACSHTRYLNSFVPSFVKFFNNGFTVDS